MRQATCQPTTDAVSDTPVIAMPGSASSSTPEVRALDVLIAALPALLAAALALLPFLGKAYTIDDTLFLRQAEHALIEPFQPAAFDIAWFNTPQRLSTIMPSGPIMPWLLAPVVKYGALEWMAHLVTLGMLCLGLLGTVALAMRAGLSRLGASVAALIVVATPAVMGMAATVMPDVPSMALGVLGMERLYAWKTSRSLHWGIAAGVLLGVASLTRSHLVMLLPAGALLLLEPEEIFDLPLALLRRRAATIILDGARVRSIAARLWPLALGLSVLVAGMRLTRDRTGGGVTSSVLTFLSHHELDRNLIAFFFDWVVAAPLALPWAILRRRSLEWRRMWQLVPAFVILLTFSGELQWAFFVAPLASVAALVLWDVLSDGWRRRDQLQLVLGAWLLLGLPVVLYNNYPAKFLVPSAPAVGMLLWRLLERETPRARLRVGLGTVSLGLLLGLAIVKGDARFAGIHRRAVAELIAPHVARGEPVWFAGHWGFQWYAERAGAHPLALGVTPPRVGDRMVSSAAADSRILEHFPNRRRLSSIIDDTPGGRVMSHRDCAGFYTNHIGYLPWSWGSGIIDEVDEWEMQ